MARAADRKVAVARRLYDLAVNEYGLRPGALVFDALTFTLATGDPEFANSAIETLQGIRSIKAELPGVLCSLGVSNLSFGLSPKARPVLNSVMLYHAVQAGLDAAIIKPAQVTPYADISSEERQLAEDLIFNRRPDALALYIQHFESASSSAEPAATDPTDGMTPQARLHWRILHRHKEGVEEDIDELIQLNDFPNQHASAVNILNTVLLPAMKEVGDKFGAGELILPFVLQSAEVMKKAVSHLETYLEKKAGVTKGTIVLATVYGDVHDIGKNLVKTILSNNGFTVIDLGKQVPAETIITKAVEVDATAIGLSALLVNTSKQMPLIVNELQRRSLKFPVLIGGAAINRRFGRRIVFTEDGSPYEPGVYYCKDAFEGLDTMEALIDPQARAGLRSRLQEEADFELGRATPHPQHSAAARSAVTPAPLPLKGKPGVHLVKDIPLELVFQALSKNELFRLSWGAKNAHGQEWDKIQADYEDQLLKMEKQALKEGWLKPQGVYGIFLCQSEGDDLIIYDPESPVALKPLTRFSFPRQPSDQHLCLADYFAPVETGQLDVVAFQVVTVGREASERFDRIQAANEYSEAYFLHGLAVQTAEATAEYLHQHIQRELGLRQGQGKRYSWGYPAIPDLADHRKVFDLLPAERELGMSLTTSFQLVPEQSTAAIIVHHPQAKYYTLGESRLEQLTK